MELKVLASGSTGNCYILQNDSEALILEAGVPYIEVLRALKTKNVVGCLVTHEHKDHSKYVKDYLNHAVKVYMTAGTLHALDDIGAITLPLLIEQGGTLRIGGFDVKCFATVHDAAEPVGFLIRHQETGKIVFATDTQYLPCRFRNVETLMVECNYHEAILQGRDIPQSLKSRIRDAHMELDTCIEAVTMTAPKQRVVLLHVSEGNGDPELFQKQVALNTPSLVSVAKPGLEIDIDEIPF